MVGGYAAAAGCAIIGPRIGRFNADGTVSPLTLSFMLNSEGFSLQGFGSVVSYVLQVLGA